MFQSLIRSALAAAVFLGISSLSTAAPAQSKDQTAIVQVMQQGWGQAGAPLQVKPIVVAGDDAIAGWVQDQRGGRALLKRKHGHWSVVLCSGEALKHSDILMQTGMSADHAKHLSGLLATAEGKLPAAIRNLFDSFEGTVMVEETQGHHGHGAGHSK